MTPLDPDPLHVDDDRLPRHDPQPERRGCWILPFLTLLAIVFLSSLAAPREAHEPAASPVARGPLGVSLGTSQVLPRATVALDAAVAGPGAEARSPASGTPQPSGEIGTALMAGNISWADPELGGDYLATRFPRGTLVRLCSERPVCILRTSNDFGPSAAIDPPRIADLAVLDWEQLCGLPRSRGLCFGTIEALEDIPLPQTDQEDAP